MKRPRGRPFIIIEGYLLLGFLKLFEAAKRSCTQRRHRAQRQRAMVPCSERDFGTHVLARSGLFGRLLPDSFWAFWAPRAQFLSLFPGEFPSLIQKQRENKKRSCTQRRLRARPLISCRQGSGPQRARRASSDGSRQLSSDSLAVGGRCSL